MKIRTEKVIDVDQWDELVSETYERPYKFQQQDGCKEREHFRLTVPAEASDYENDTIEEKVNGSQMGVSLEAWKKRDPNQMLGDEDEDQLVQWVIDLWWDRNFYPDVQMVANDLHARGLLEAGEYIISIDW